MPVPPDPHRVADHLALLELVATYAQTVDAHDLDGLVACFAPDARLEFVSSGQVFRGTAGIRQFYVGAFETAPMAGGVSTHVMTNSIVRFDGPDHAGIVTQAIAHLAAPGAGTVVARGLTYTDRCVRTDSGWCFADRIHRLHWQGAYPGGPTAG